MLIRFAATVTPDLGTAGGNAQGFADAFPSGGGCAIVRATHRCEEAPMHVISTSDLMGPDWNFLADLNSDPALTFRSFSSQQPSGLAALVRHPVAARVQAAARACRAARRRSDAVLFTHLPMSAAITNLTRRVMAPRVPQVAFAFNFTTLRDDTRRKFFARAFRGIAEFAVFSTYERELYAEAFGIKPDRLAYLPWTMETPVPGPENPMAGKGPYVCAVGGEARDYATFATAMRARPTLPAAVVARDYSLAGVDMPPNVSIFTNLAASKTWALLAGAEAMVLPLRDARAACGHITLVAARLLGIPIIVTDSVGIRDYTGGGRVAALVPPGSAEAIEVALDRVLGDDVQRQQARTGVALARQEHDPRLWLDYVREKAALLGPAG